MIIFQMASTLNKKVVVRKKEWITIIRIFGFSLHYLIQLIQNFSQLWKLIPHGNNVFKEKKN